MIGNDRNRWKLISVRIHDESVKQPKKGTRFPKYNNAPSIENPESYQVHNPKSPVEMIAPELLIIFPGEVEPEDPKRTTLPERHSKQVLDHLGWCRLGQQENMIKHVHHLIERNHSNWAWNGMLKGVENRTLELV